MNISAFCPLLLAKCFNCPTIMLLLILVILDSIHFFSCLSHEPIIISYFNNLPTSLLLVNNGTFFISCFCLLLLAIYFSSSSISLSLFTTSPLLLCWPTNYLSFSFSWIFQTFAFDQLFQLFITVSYFNHVSNTLGNFQDFSACLLTFHALLITTSNKYSGITAYSTCSAM